ncbi:MAG: isoprenylcysteine carboxylmethyltransferase family protein [Myxococcales bacterium]|nr:isoprenylcysteine carboxylmethyltransferase family protein [Myxococcales bacterium]
MGAPPTWSRGTEFDFRHRVAINVLTIGAGVGAAWVERLARGRPSFWIERPAMCVLAMATAALGIAVRAWATGYLPFGIIGDRELHTPRLVDTGPFGVVRNPLYLGTWIALTSFGWLLNLAGLAAIAAAMGLKIHRLIDYEEQRLNTVFGPAYADYRRRVPRLWPRSWRGAAEALAAKTDWLYGLRGNVFLMGLVAGYAAAIFRPSIGVVLGCGLLGLVAQWPMLRRERSNMKTRRDAS